MGGKAIAYLKNGLGNCVLMMPAVQALRDLSGQSVDVVIPDDWRDRRRAAVEDIYKAWPTVGQIFNYPRGPISPSEYDYWHYSQHHSASDATEFFRRHAKQRPIPRPSWRGTLIHERDHYLDIAWQMGWRGTVPKIEMPTADVPMLNLPRPLIGLCNGAFRTAIWERKCWPHFDGFARVAKAYFGGSVIGLGGAKELDSVSMDTDLTGKIPILETNKVISQLDLLVCTDTALMHLADAMSIPLIALFGSTLLSKNAPIGKKSHVIMSTIDCAPCFDLVRFRSCQDALCMEKITVRDVMGIARKILRSRTELIETRQHGV